MDVSLYDKFLYIVSTGDEALAKDFLEKNKDKFSEATKIALSGIQLTPATA